MAFIDYGCIVFKNGKIVNKSSYFNDMKEMVGWSDKGTKTPIYDDFHKTEYDFELFDNCFGYVGDEDLTVGFYKTVMYIYQKESYIPDTEEPSPCIQSIWVNSCDYTWSKWSKTYFHHNDVIDMIVKPRNGYLVFKMKYKGNKYKVYFGYGVDLDCYKKWHLVNYYRTPWYLVKKFFNYNIKEFIYDVKLRFHK